MRLHSSITVELAAANAQTDEDEKYCTLRSDFASIDNVEAHITVENTGLAYTADSLSVEVFQIKNVGTTNPLSNGPDSRYLRTGMEPAALSGGGEVFTDNDFEEPIGIQNSETDQNGYISVRVKRTGGDATSHETYQIDIYGRDD